MIDTSLHERRRSQRQKDPEFRAAYAQARREIAQTDAIIRALDKRRIELGLSKAQVARLVNRNASSIRRLFTTTGTKPALPLVTAIATALDAEVTVVPKKATKKSAAAGKPAKDKTVERSKTREREPVPA